MKKETNYTYTTASDYKNDNYNCTVDKSSTTNNSLNYYNDYWCHYLLPCGICERTGRPCQKHGTTPINWNEWTCKTSEFDSSMSNSYTTNVSGEFTSSYSIDKQYNKDLFNDK